MMSVNKNIPILFERKELCCGCAACYSICPENAITMEVDDEGFEYPIINETICVKCLQCIKACPIKHKVT